MAEKYSVLIKYEYLEIAENAKLSDEDFGKLMKAVIAYDKDEKMPKFKKQSLSMAFMFIKCDIDKNRKKWEERVTVNIENGRKGGRPKNPTEPKKPNGLFENPTKPNETENNRTKPNETQNNPSEPKKPVYDLDLDSDLDHEYESSSRDINLVSGGGVAEKPPPLEAIIQKSKQAGFPIDTKLARQFQDRVRDPSWLEDHSFLEFCAVFVCEKYPDKKLEQLKGLYISAVLKWDELLDIYPAWKKEQGEKAEMKNRKREIERVRRNQPQVCACGEILEYAVGWDAMVCTSCTKRYVFDEAQIKWVLKE